ncbi:DUF192 domain-containing protein [Spiroplasma citri]|uniref:DUF192 domain-containing protein n=1 Tax=Spiroplasma citri TaxID=2133 RepID=Q14ME3_SPICI|nr:DUF192 domain-containing protein [Spiroplasma citri]APE74663.1 hypothetical protein SCITRI_00770 [Spiroplasma citri]QED24499.1 hypothetical protein FRX96_03415 [Spiroplasma citri]QIA66895.1 hypothetical protein GMI18_04075 [Spiroplasma citri]QIA68720.1 hypothetical protein GL298_03875 [Spiroplasma citri]QIA70581.1 hypothetical protein GL981_03890 [Spiroplasma citri]
MGFFSKVIYKFHRTKHKRNKKYYLLKNRKSLIVNSIPQDINIHVIKTFREKFTSLIQPNDITMKNGYLLRKVRGFNSFGIFYQLDVIFCNKNFEVIHTIQNFGPQKMSHYFPQCYFVYCLAPGMINFLNIKPNDILRII